MPSGYIRDNGHTAKKVFVPDSDGYRDRAKGADPDTAGQNACSAGLHSSLKYLSNVISIIPVRHIAPDIRGRCWLILEKRCAADMYL